MSPVGTLLAHFILIVWSGFVIFPVYWFTISTFKGTVTDFSTAHYLPFIDFEPTLDAWRSVLNYYPNCNISEIGRHLAVIANNGAAYVLSPVAHIEPMEPRLCLIWLSVVDSLITSLSATALSIITGSMAAYGLARMQYKPRIGNIIAFVLLCAGMIVATTYVGMPWYVSAAVALALFFLLVRTLGRYFKASVGNGAILFWMISQRILPPVLVAFPFYMTFQSVGLLDTTAALILVYAVTNLPIVVWLMHDFFGRVPLDLEDAAMLEGASRFTIFWEIVFPLTRTGLAATALLCLILNWNEYIFAVSLTLRHAPTLTVFAEMWGESTVFFLMIIPPVIMSVFLLRYISRGTFLGGVKG